MVYAPRFVRPDLAPTFADVFRTSASEEKRLMNAGVLDWSVGRFNRTAPTDGASQNSRLSGYFSNAPIAQAQSIRYLQAATGPKYPRKK